MLTTESTDGTESTELRFIKKAKANVPFDGVQGDILALINGKD